MDDPPSGKVYTHSHAAQLITPPHQAADLKESVSFFKVGLHHPSHPMLIARTQWQRLWRCTRRYLCPVEATKAV
jgi:hypothetical protein